MLALPKKLFHAIEAVLLLSYRATIEPVSGKELCEKLGLPPRYLEAMMQQLVRVNILRGVRGPSGGYQLARASEDVTLADICLALRDEEEPPLSGVCEQMQAQSLAYLQTISLASLGDKAGKAFIKREGAQLIDFTI